MSKKAKGRGGSDKTVLKADVIARYLTGMAYSDDFQGMQYQR